MSEREDTTKVTNDVGDGGGALSELIRLQAEFQTKLAEETMRYLRRVQGRWPRPRRALSSWPAAISRSRPRASPVDARPSASGWRTVSGCTASSRHSSRPSSRRRERPGSRSPSRRPCRVLLAPGESETLEVVIVVPEALPEGEVSRCTHSPRISRRRDPGDRHGDGGGKNPIAGEEERQGKETPMTSRARNRFDQARRRAARSANDRDAPRVARGPIDHAPIHLRPDRGRFDRRRICRAGTRREQDRRGSALAPRARARACVGER